LKNAQILPTLNVTQRRVFFFLKIRRFSTWPRLLILSTLESQEKIAGPKFEWTARLADWIFRGYSKIKSYDCIWSSSTIVQICNSKLQFLVTQAQHNFFRSTLCLGIKLKETFLIGELKLNKEIICKDSHGVCTITIHRACRFQSSDTKAVFVFLKELCSFWKQSSSTETWPLIRQLKIWIDLWYVNWKSELTFDPSTENLKNGKVVQQNSWNILNKWTITVYTILIFSYHNSMIFWCN
jgi:hypothetical protein